MSDHLPLEILELQMIVELSCYAKAESLEKQVTLMIESFLKNLH